jgi:ribosomal-protein-alanine N-acetyltransferase
MIDRRASPADFGAQIRTVGAFDLPSLAEVHAAGFAEAWDVGALASLLAMPGAQGLLAEQPDSGEALGFVLLRAVAGEAEILTIVVKPGSRRKGVGRRLLQAAVASAAASGAERLFLEVAPDNGPAHALYLAAGFAEIARRANYYRRKSGTITALVLAKDIGTTSIDGCFNSKTPNN